MSNHDYHLINDEDSLLKSSNNNHQDFYQNYLSSVQVPILSSNTAANNVMASLMNRKVSLKQLTNGNKLQAPFVNVQPAMVMNYRNVGKNGLKAPMLGFSAWNSFASNENAADEVLTAAYENGINYFDTGDGFGDGQSEIVLGKILSKKSWPRSSYIVSTKIFWKNGPTSHPGQGLSRKFIIEAVEASLRRLQLRYIDILIINKLDATCPMEEIVRTMSYLINNGIIFYWGSSRFSPMHISEAFCIARQFNCPPPICEQMEYHMLNRDKMELHMLELFHKAGIGCIVWSPISLDNDEGIQLISRKQNIFDTKLFQNSKYSELLLLCDKLGCDIVQLSLAWCLQNENVNCVMISATSLQELHKKLDSIKFYSMLTSSINDEIDKILANNPVLKRQIHKNPSITVDVAEECDDV